MPKKPTTYRPGSRTAKYRRKDDGRMSPNRLAWLRNIFGQMAIMVYPEDDQHEVEEEESRPDDPETGPSIYIIFPRRAGRPLMWNLTALTEEELQLTRQFFDLAFNTAEPIVKHRDKVAHDAFAEGDDSYTRLYRQVPQFVVREGPLTENGERVLDRFANLLAGTGSESGSDGGVRGDGDELAPGESSPGSSQDDGTQTDES